MKKKLFITGTPGVGKTSLLKEVTLPYLKHIGGFFTHTIIENNKRAGFLLKTCAGEEGVLAKKGMESKHKLNKYGIDISIIDNLGVTSLESAIKTNNLIVIDEIGSMEIISPKFCETVVKCINSDKHILATIRYNAQPFTDDIKRMDNCEILVLTRDNYIETKSFIRSWLDKIMSNR